jgi:diguanylate cyclase (GGDEF)-like protein
MHPPGTEEEQQQPGFAWLFELPPRTERSMRMEALIARLRLLVILINCVLMAFFLDTSGMQTELAWLTVTAVWLYAVPVALLQPYRRWRVFETGIITGVADSITTMVFIAVTGGWESPFYLLLYLSVAAIAMRFDLRQALAACGVYAASYALIYFATWDPGRDEFGAVALRLAYLLFIAVGVGHLAREENHRARQIDEIERLHAENQRLHHRSERAARLDRLTGLFNRAAFEKEAQKELRRAKSGGYVSVLFCDMDRLKRINDELGHDAGDRVLRSVGSAMKRTLRREDLIGRYGGDEFVVVMPNVTRETAYDRADQLIEAVQSVNESLTDDLRVGLSVGIAVYPFDAQDYPTLVRLADQAMYLAKREGGDRSRTANDLRLFWEEIPHSA